MTGGYLVTAEAFDGREKGRYAGTDWRRGREMGKRGKGDEGGKGEREGEGKEK